MAQKIKTIKQKVFVPASPEEVYEAFVSPKKHSEFTESRATGGGKEGERFTAWDGYIFGKVLKLVKGKKIIQEWKTTEWPEGHPSSVLELTFNKKEGGSEMDREYFDHFEKDGTSYSVYIKHDPFFLDKYGGRYLTVLFIGNHGKAYFLNPGYKHYSYIMEHFGFGVKDSQNFADKLNEVLDR